MNKVILMGRLTRDPEVRYSQGERSMAIARYTLAVDRRGRSNHEGYKSVAKQLAYKFGFEYVAITLRESRSAFDNATRRRRRFCLCPKA